MAHLRNFSSSSHMWKKLVRLLFMWSWEFLPQNIILLFILHLCCGGNVWDYPYFYFLLYGLFLFHFICIGLFFNLIPPTQKSYVLSAPSSSFALQFSCLCFFSWEMFPSSSLCLHFSLTIVLVSPLEMLIVCNFSHNLLFLFSSISSIIVSTSAFFFLSVLRNFAHWSADSNVIFGKLYPSL